MAKRWMWIWVLTWGGLAQAQDGSDDGKPRVFPKREPGAKHGTVEYRDENKVYTIALPDDWVVEAGAARGKVVFAADVRLPGSTESAQLELVREESAGDPRGRPAIWQPPEGARIERRHEPLPHVVVSGDDQRAVIVFRRIRGNPIELRLTCPEADFEDAYPDALQGMATLAAELEFWPPVPEGYKTKRKGRYLFASHPSVKRFRNVERMVRDCERGFTRVHGKLPKADRDEPTVVIIHADKSQARDLCKEAAESLQGYLLDRQGRLFAVPLEEDDAIRAAHLTHHLEGLFLRIKYGQSRPNWLFDGDQFVATAEDMTGKPLPNLVYSYSDWMVQPLRKISELEAFRAENPKDYQAHCFWYVALFRIGPSAYRKAYRHLLDDCAEGRLATEAFAEYFGEFGEDELRAAAEKVQRSVKLVRPK